MKVTRSPLAAITLMVLILAAATVIQPVLDTIVQFVRDIAPYVGWGVVLFLVVIIVLRVLNAWKA